MNNKILILVIVHCQFSRTEDRNIKITAFQADTWELHNSLGARSTILSNGYACQTEACIHATALIRASPRCFLGSCSRPIMHQSELLLHRENLSDVLQRSSAVRSLDRQITDGTASPPRILYTIHYRRVYTRRCSRRRVSSERFVRDIP